MEKKMYSVFFALSDLDSTDNIWIIIISVNFIGQHFPHREKQLRKSFQVHTYPIPLSFKQDIDKL